MEVVSAVGLLKGFAFDEVAEAGCEVFAKLGVDACLRVCDLAGYSGAEDRCCDFPAGLGLCHLTTDGLDGESLDGGVCELSARLV